MAEPGAGPRRSWRGWTRGEGLIVVAGVLLIADLVTLPWHHFATNYNFPDIGIDLGELGVDLPRFALDRTGIQSPDGNLGIAALVLAGLMVVLVLAAKVNPGLRRHSQIHLVAGPAALGLLTAKFLSNDHYLGSGAWGGMLLALGLAIGGYMLSQESSVGAGGRAGVAARPAEVSTR